MDPLRALAHARPLPFWLDSSARPAPEPALIGDVRCDLLVVGGGYSGLWTALLAKERRPDTDVVLVEGREVGWAASGRNGGFCAHSLTHGLDNGLQRWPEEIDVLERLGMDNLDAIEETVARHGIDCDFRRSGEISVATEEHQVAWLRQEAEEAGRHREPGDRPRFLDAEQVRAEVGSPLFLAGLWDRRGTAMLDPARLAWGLKRACLEAGVRIFEHTPARALARSGPGIAVRTPHGRIGAHRVALGTNVFPSLLRRVRPYLVPVYDYALMTEPLDAAQLASVGWHSRAGAGDVTNQFHYFRISADNRILWGGYDAVARFGGHVRSEYDQRPETFARLATHFFRYFPQLEGVRFSHAWGGAIDTCTRFSPFFGTAHDARVAYAAGFTGLGVGATRFGAQVMLDLLHGERTERTELEMVRRKPLPFPPEPVRFAGIQATRRALDAADRNQGRRNLWLRTLDACGMGFDS